MKTWLPAFAALMLMAMPAQADDNFKFDGVGTVQVTRPAGSPQSVAVVFSDADGWSPASAAVATALANEGALVLGVDWKVYRAHLNANGGSCVYPSADIAGLVQYGEKTLGLPRYIQPILVGLGDAGSAVYPLFAQPPVDTFKGALGVGFCPTLKTAKPLCKGHSPDLSSTAVKGGFTYAPAVSGLDNFVALEGISGQACDAAAATAFVGKMPGSQAIQIDASKDQTSQIVAAYQGLVGTETAFQQAQRSDGPPVPKSPDDESHVDISALGDLPLTVVPSQGDPKSFVIFLTGDGGWAGIDQSISDALAAQGLEIVGFNTLDYFWEAKTPLQTAADLNRVFDAIRTADPNAKIQIVGFSFGAEIAPVVYPLLADSSKAMLTRIAMLVPGTLAVFEFSSEYWLGAEPSTGDDVAAAVKADSNLPFLCIYSDDDDGACPALATGTPANVTLKVLGSGHHFSGQYDDLAKLILQD